MNLPLQKQEVNDVRSQTSRRGGGQMERLKIGYLLPTRDQSVRDEHDPGRLIAQTRGAEQLGLDSVWAGASPVSRPRADPLLLSAAAARSTERVALGTAVLLPALRHPILLAHQLATLDRLSGERPIAGVGGGFSNPSAQAQFAAVGVGFERRISRMEESIDAMRQLRSEEAVSYQGEHFSFEDVRIAPLPFSPGGPSISLAAHGPPALRRVARLADGWPPIRPRRRRTRRSARSSRLPSSRPRRPVRAPPPWTGRSARTRTRETRAGACKRAWSATTTRHSGSSPPSRPCSPVPPARPPTG
ncbi:LLM class flavin-dependent oxidoreductase [Streptomyces sp. NPDC048045]|uniref:LLM class flavin-dependent oxidoreductase n=1 Tax=Streptomyces sp. NPDC048045 TaxID=3154710 RepID=UPI003427241B